MFLSALEQLVLIITIKSYISTLCFMKHLSYLIQPMQKTSEVSMASIISHILIIRKQGRWGHAIISLIWGHVVSTVVFSTESILIKG